MKEINAERMAEFLSEVLPDDVDLAITRVTITIEPKSLPIVNIETSPCPHGTIEIWKRLQELRKTQPEH